MSSTTLAGTPVSLSTASAALLEAMPNTAGWAALASDEPDDDAWNAAPWEGRGAFRLVGIVTAADGAPAAPAEEADTDGGAPDGWSAAGGVA